MKRVEPIHVIIIGLVIAIGGVVWSNYRRPSQRPAASNRGSRPNVQYLIEAVSSKLEGSPLAWSAAPMFRWLPRADGGIDVLGIAIEGKNVGNELIQLKDVYLISGITGDRISMKIQATSLDGRTLSMNLAKDTHPIPKDAPINVSTDNLNGTDGIPENDFLKDWATFDFVAEYGGTEHRKTYDRKTISAQFAGYEDARFLSRNKPTNPRVTARKT